MLRLLINMMTEIIPLFATTMLCLLYIVEVLNTSRHSHGFHPQAQYIVPLCIIPNTVEMFSKSSLSVACRLA